MTEISHGNGELQPLRQRATCDTHTHTEKDMIESCELDVACRRLESDVCFKGRGGRCTLMQRDNTFLSSGNSDLTRRNIGVSEEALHNIKS